MTSDVFFSADPIADCVRNGCYCLTNSTTTSLWWHLQVAFYDHTKDAGVAPIEDNLAQVYGNFTVADLA